VEFRRVLFRSINERKYRHRHRNEVRAVKNPRLDEASRFPPVRRVHGAPEARFVFERPAKGGRLLNRFLRGIGIYLLVAIIAVYIVSSLYTTQERRYEATFSEFMQWVQANRVD